MLRSSLAVVCLLVALGSAEAAGASAPPAVDRAAVAAFADAELSTAYPADGPGAAVLVQLGGAPVLRRGFGLANLDLRVPIAPEHVFEIGSVTKQFTAASILRLAEEGKVALSDPIQKYVPGFPTGDATVTLEHLLHHTSGVPSYTDMPEWVSRWREDMSLETLIGIFRGKPLEFAPGSNWSYSNSGYVLLGAVIEKASGKSYEDFVEQDLLAPLGLTATRYGHQDEVVPGRVNGYQKGTGGWRNAPYLSLTQPYSAGSLMSTVDELALWTVALEQGRVVSVASLERMFAPATLADGDQAGVDTRYGLGIGVGALGGYAVHEHGGGIHGFVSALLSVPELDLVIAILSNNTASADPSLLARRIAAVAAGQSQVEPAALTLEEGRLDEYVGVYRVTDGGADPKARRIVTREGNVLRIQRTGGSLNPLVSRGEDRFAFVEGPTSVTFDRDAAARVAGLRLDNVFGPVFRSPRTDEPLPAERRAIAVDPALFDSLAGTYVLAPGFDLVVRREGDRLFVQATGQERAELFAESETRYFLDRVDAQIEFLRPASGGPATSLVLRQAGQEMPAPRKP